MGYLKNKTFGFYLSFVAAILALIGFVMYRQSGHTESYIEVLLLVTVVLQILAMIVLKVAPDFKWTSLLLTANAILTAAALVNSFYTQVDFIGYGQLEEIRKAVDIYDGLAKTGCQPLDIILSEKNLLCEKYQIKFSYMIDGEKLTGIKSGDIAAIFGNALDNAIECAAELPVEKRIISLIGYARQDVMGIHIENYCEDELEFRNGLPVSTKGDDNYHGFGMKSIQYVVEKYGGNLVANLEEKIFSVDIIFPVLD